MSIELVIPSNHLILCPPLLLLPSVFPSNRVFSNESVHRIRRPKYWTFSFNISPSNACSGLDSQFLESPRNSQESSPTPQFKSINSLVLSFLYSLILTSIHDYWKNHSLDQMDLCWQSNVSAFQYAVSLQHFIFLSSFHEIDPLHFISMKIMFYLRTGIILCGMDIGIRLL